MKTLVLVTLVLLAGCKAEQNGRYQMNDRGLVIDTQTGVVKHLQYTDDQDNLGKPFSNYSTADEHLASLAKQLDALKAANDALEKRR